MENQKYVVQKYGGSSVSDAEKIKDVAGRIELKLKAGYKVIIVVSAMGKTTDGLIKLARQITDRPAPRELDMLLSTGEQVSVSLLSMAIQCRGYKSVSLNAFQAGIKTTSTFNDAKIKSFDKNKIMSLFKTNDVLVVTGFQGISEEGEVTTLGRGGSDTSAVALAAALGFDVEIYSDVPGIFTIDPRLYPKAKKVKYLTYDEMLELAGLGAKVLHSRSVEIAKKYGITIYCGSTFTNEEGSYVMGESKMIEQPLVTGCSVMDNQTQVFIKNLPVDYTRVKQLFEKVAVENLNVDMISIINSGNSLDISFTIVEEKKRFLEAALKKVFAGLGKCEIIYKTGFVKLSVVGIGMRSGVGVAASFFKALKNIPIRLVTTSEIAISCLVEAEFKQQAVEAVAKEFKL
jgi:aspartate kinase